MSLTYFVALVYFLFLFLIIVHGKICCEIVYVGMNRGLDKCGAGGVSERDQRCEQLREATVFAQKSVQEK